MEVEVPAQSAWWWNQPISVLSLESPITVSNLVSIYMELGEGEGGGGVVCMPVLGESCLHCR